MTCPCCPDWDKQFKGVHAEAAAKLDAALLRNRELMEALERARTYTGIEAQGCPLCTYVEGDFVASCSLHRQLEEQLRLYSELVERCAKIADVEPWSEGPVPAVVLEASKNLSYEQIVQAAVMSTRESIAEKIRATALKRNHEVFPPIAGPTQCGEWTQFGQCIAEKLCKVHGKRKDECDRHVHVYQNYQCERCGKGQVL